MKRMVLLFAATFGLFSAPAIAADVHDGVTLNELEAALKKSFVVERQKGSSGTFLMVTGRENVIGARLVHCGNSVRCEGVEFFAVLDRKYSLAQANDFNIKYSYSKMLLLDSMVGIQVEMHVDGGVTPQNLVENALITMVREDKANQSTVATAQYPGVQNQLSSDSTFEFTQLLASKSVTGNFVSHHDRRRAAALVRFLEASEASNRARIQ